MSHIFIYDANYRDIQIIVDTIFTQLEIDLQGRRVFIKPNAVHEMEPELAANTHPSLLAAVIRAVEDAGAADIRVGDNPGIQNYGRIPQLFRANGLGAVTGDYLENIGRGLIPKRIPSLGATDLYFPKIIFEADYIINLPKLKTHPNTGITSAIKNCFGYLAGGQKAYCHQISKDRRHFEHMLADIYHLRRPDLTLVDAILIPEGGGRSSKTLRYLGKVLASHSGVAVDVLGSSMLGLEPSSIYHLVAAAAFEPVSLDAQALEIIGHWDVAEGFRLPRGFNPGESPVTTVSRPGLLEAASSKKLMVNSDRCTKCGECISECPTAALYFEDEILRMTQAQCVACFACMEACSQQALRLESLCPENKAAASTPTARTR